MTFAALVIFSLFLVVTALVVLWRRPTRKVSAPMDCIGAATVDEFAVPQQSSDAMFLSTVPALLFRISMSPDQPGISVNFVNDKMEEMLGYTQEDLQSNPNLLFDVMHPDDRLSYESIERSVNRECENCVLEHRFRHKDGTYRWIRRHLRRSLDPNSGLSEWFGCGIDISDLKEAESRLVDFLESAPDPVITTNNKGAIVLVNAQAERTFGYTKSELLGQPIWNLLAEHEQNEMTSRLAAYLANPVCQSNSDGIEVCASQKDGTEFPVEVSFSPLHNGQDSLIAFAVRDISKRKQTEAQLQQAQKMEAVGQLTGGIAHDFNNLLTIVIGNLQLLEISCPQDEEIGNAMGAALDAALRGAELTRRLLAFSRQQLLTPKVTDVNELVRNVAPLLKRTLGEDIHLATVLDSDLWLTQVDASQLENSLVNLAINARDAMPRGGRLTIETVNAALESGYTNQYSDVRAGDYVLVVVSDNGEGISGDALPHVFDPFFSTKEVGKGSGLGLSMVHGFVKQSNGHIKIYSEEDHGTVVKIYLPRTASPSDTVEDTTTMRMGIPNGNESILLVEDEPAVRRIAKDLLEMLGYEVIHAESGADALRILEPDSGFDLLFTDIIMPGGMTGVELATLARERCPGLKVLYTSGYTNSSVFDNGLLQPGDVVLNKPYRKEQLAQFVRDILDRE